MKHYFEFDDHDYYALVVVTVEKDDLYTKPSKKAAELYVEVVAGESVDEILEEAEPNLRTKEYAFMKFMRAHDDEDRTVKEVLTQFDEAKNEVLLVDRSLL